ncbi:MFS general substrate transporter [Aaosphaeria arxii CBS 175.79]|uniref:MFS general substrate transporter n=1 Tax=Aaosphaeria arxii CBS 175.79 TaxID=1450172 RepID=A0A6A5X6H1_9PLEO|nr:MFS general substrate transporter [Aaosphaeria arxii CBS 175.79]KAF2008481.1 MFS general substrate transporter [Aaosphaeria arxii CBS 175.79]
MGSIVRGPGGGTGSAWLSPPYSAYTPARRRLILAIVTIAGFFGPLCGAVYLPSLVLFQDVFHTSATVINATVSVYMAVFAVAPLFGAAASDFGGRKTVYIVGLGSFLIANILLATLPANIGLLFVLRIFQAFGSCIVFSVGAGTVADITEPKRRGAALSWFLLGPQLGPILGPLIGGQFAHVARWRWAFGFLALACFPLYLLILFCLPETLRSLVGNGEALTKKPWFFLPKFRQMPIEDIDGKKFPKPPRPTLKKFLHLLAYPPHLIVSINGALQFAGLYAIYITFPKVWQKEFGFSTQEVGYAFLVPGFALFVTSIAVGRISDAMRARAIRNSPNDKVVPERRIPIQIVGFVIACVGKLMYGWFTKYRINAAGGLFGSAFAAVGTSIIFVTSTSFQTECDPSQAASLVALGGLLRNIAAAIGAVIMDELVKRMGYGWCFTGLAALDILCIPGIILIMIKGAKFREQLNQKMKA